MTLAYLDISSKKKCLYRLFIYHFKAHTISNKLVSKVFAQKKGKKSYASYKYVLQFRWFQVESLEAKKTDSSCPLCGHKQPTIHLILCNFPVALQQGRYTWRHDSALLTWVKVIQEYFDSDVMLYADLPGMLANDTQYPSYLKINTLVTSFPPDIVIVGEDKVTLIELTIPHNS